MIHPTAVIDPKAQIDSDVVVGPYVLIEGPVRISSGTEIQGHAVITGSVLMGKNNRVGYGSVIGSFPQDLSYNPKANSGVEIGENNVIRENCTIHRGTKETYSFFLSRRYRQLLRESESFCTRLVQDVCCTSEVSVETG